MAAKRSKVTLKDIVDAGLIQPGQALRFLRRSPVTAKITDHATLVVQGVEYKSLSAAATAVVGNQVNGWAIWRVEDANGDLTTLAELRARLEKKK